MKLKNRMANTSSFPQKKKKKSPKLQLPEFFIRLPDIGMRQNRLARAVCSQQTQRNFVQDSSECLTFQRLNREEIGKRLTALIAHKSVLRPFLSGISRNNLVIEFQSEQFFLFLFFFAPTALPCQSFCFSISPVKNKKRSENWILVGTLRMRQY